MTRRLKFAMAASLLVMLVGTIGLGSFYRDPFQPGLGSQADHQPGGTQNRGSKVEMNSFAFDIWHLRFVISGLTVHGLEKAGSPPLFRADRIDLDARIISLLHKQIALDRLVMDRPQVFVRVENDGSSNVPKPRQTGNNRPWRDILFSLRIGLLNLQDGSATFNDRRVPLEMQGRNLEFTLQYAAPPGTPDLYVGDLRWQQVRLADKRNVPFLFDVSTRFTLRRNSFDVDNLTLKLPHSELDLRAEMASFARPDWNLHYRGQLGLQDVRTIFRAPTDARRDRRFFRSGAISGESILAG